MVGDIPKSAATVALCVLLGGFFTAAAGQLLPQAANTDDAATSAQPLDSLGRSTPRGTVDGFIDAVTQQDYRRAASYIDVDTPSSISSRARLARKLELLLDEHGNMMPYSWISDDSSGRQEDGLPPGTDRVGTVEVEGQTIPLLVEDIKDAEDASVWLFSAETMGLVAATKNGSGAPLVNEVLPDALEDDRWSGVPVGHWLLMVFIAVAAYFVAQMSTAIGFAVARKFWKLAREEPTAGIIRACALPVRLGIALTLFLVAGKYLGFSIVLRQRLSDVTAVTGLLVVLLLLWRVTDFVTHYTERRLLSRQHPSALSAVLFFRRLAKIGIVVMAVIAVLAAIGVDVATGLAALGIGGLALALGAQKSMENFVGGVTLIADQPIRVGDFCKAGDVMGTVEAIGMRSTQIRTLDHTVVTIPNGELSSNMIENFTHRKKYRFISILRLRYETTPDQVRSLLADLRSILCAHPKVDPDPARIRFVELGPASLNLEVFAYINASDYDDFLEIREELLLRMIDAVKEEGTGLALPSQTVYLSRDRSQVNKMHREETVRAFSKERRT